MSRGPILLCPICKVDVGMDAVSTTDAQERLAKHMVAAHTRMKNGQAVLQVPDGPKPYPDIIHPAGSNRASRRRAAKAQRGSSYRNGKAPQ